MECVGAIEDVHYDGTLHSNCSSCFSPFTSNKPCLWPQSPITLPLFYTVPLASLYLIHTLTSPQWIFFPFYAISQIWPTSALFTSLKEPKERFSKKLNLENIENPQNRSQDEGVWERVEHLRTNRERLMTPVYIQKNGILEKIRSNAGGIGEKEALHGNIVVVNATDQEEHEMVLCVQTQAVEVHDSSGLHIGMAVYGTKFLG